MKKALLFVLAFLLIFLVVLLVAPTFVDWNAYRRDVAAAIVQVTGREVTIAGDLELSILPLPRLSVRRISIASVDGAIDRDLLQIGELRIELAVASLLTGQIAVRSMSLVDPVLTLETTADGRHSWQLTPVEPARAPHRLASVISIDTVAVSNGTLAWRAAGAQPQQLQAIEATLAMGGPTDMTRMRGNARFRHVPFQLFASIGRPRGGDPAAFSVTIDIDGSAGRLAATGQVDWTRRLAGGDIRITAPDANALGRSLSGGDAPRLPAWNIAAESTFSADSNILALPDIELTFGEVRGTGEARLALDDVPALHAKLVIGTVNLDQVAAAVAGERPAEGQSAEPRLAAAPFGLAQDFTADLDLEVRTARWRDGVIRDFGADIRLEPRGVSIDRLAMKLPGGTDVTLSGMEPLEEVGAGLQGDLAVLSDNLRGTLLWAGTANDQLPSDRLRSLSFTSRIAVTPDAVRLANIAARLDATRMTGGATIMRQARPSFGLRLDLDRLELDAYLPESLRHVPDAAKEDLSGFRTAGLFDANLVLSVGTLTLAGRTASQVALDAQLFDGDVLLRKLSIGDLGGAALAVTGAIKDVADTPAGDLEFALEARDAERFAEFIDAYPGSIASRIGRVRLDAHVSGTAQRADVAGTIALAGGELRAEGTLTDLDTDPAIALALAVSHPDSDGVLNLLAPGRSYGGIGPMAMTFDLARSADSLAIRNLDASLGDMTIAGRVDVVTGGPRPAVSAILTAGSLDMDRLLPASPRPLEDATLPARRGSARWSRRPIDLSALRALDLDLTLRSDTVLHGTTRLAGLQIHAALAGGVLTMDRLTGNLFDGSIEASAKIDVTASAPIYAATIAGHGVAARRALAALAHIDRLEGPVAFSVSLSAMGRTPFDLVSTLSGTGALSGTVRIQQHGNEPIPTGPVGDAMDTLLKAFAPTPATLIGEFRIVDGTLRTTDLRLAGGGVQTLTMGMADLPGWRIESTTTLHRGEDGNAPPELVVRLGGSLDDPAVRLSGPAAAADEDAAPVPEPAPVTPVEPVAPASATGQGTP